MKYSPASSNLAPTAILKKGEFMKNKMGTELIENPVFKFGNFGIRKKEPNYRNKKIFDMCLKEVFKLDKYFYDKNKQVKKSIMI
jgi:hypothetical protein